MLRSRTLKAALASSSLLALAAPLQAHAQQTPAGVAQSPPAAAAPAGPAPTDPNANQVSEVVVTAQKRAERVQDVPESVTVTSQAQLERQQVNQISDLSRVTPSLEIQQAQGQSVGGGGQIRGIGTQSFQAGAVGSVGIVVDQVSQGNVNISDLFDVGRIEVLKGPQGTLFGLTTSAGVVNIVTNDPILNNFSGRFRTQLSPESDAGSEFGQQVVQGVVNVPLGDTAAARISANYDKREGVDRNTYTGDLDDQETYGARARILWKPTSNLRVNLIGDYTHTDADGIDFFVIYKANPQLAATLASCGITASDNNRNYCSNTPTPNKSSTYGGSAQVDYDLGYLTLTSITSLRRQQTDPATLNIFRLDPNVEHVLQGPTVSSGSLFTQELRVASPNSARIQYTAGLFYSRQSAITRFAPFQLTLYPFPGVVIPAVDIMTNATDLKGESSAAFGQATAKITDNLKLIVGARYTHETLGVTTASFYAPIADETKTDIDNFSWKIGPQYEFSRNLQAYAFIAKGYKGPQIALPDPSNPAARPTLIKPEVPTDYEAGLKSTMFGGRLFADLNVFYFDDKNYQGQVCTPAAAGGLNCVPQNISSVVSKGVEFDLSGQPIEGLTFNSGIIWNRAEYPSGFLGQDGSSLGGEQLLGAPEWKFTTSGEYARPVWRDLQGFIGGDVVFKSETRYAASTDPNTYYGDHWTLGLRAGVRDLQHGWSASVFVRNLTESREPVVRYATFPDGSVGSYGQILTPQAFRLVGVELTASF